MHIMAAFYSKAFEVEGREQEREHGDAEEAIRRKKI